jgi:phage FluMu gp28-like protein
MNDALKYFLPYQRSWILDPSPLKIFQKSRQIGISFTDAYHSVRTASLQTSRLDVYISSRDRFQAKLYIEDCKHWANILHELILDLGEVMLDPDNDSAFAIQFANGRRIYSLSSNPNALAGKRGHVKLDEFALHQDQRLLYRVAKPVTTWGGTLSIFSTHRGPATLFNQLITEIDHGGNPMGWSLHSVTLEKAVSQGLVEKINQKTGGKESRAAFLARIRAECIDEEQWLQEYCCIPADESAAFISHDMINACEDPHVQLLTFAQLQTHLQTKPPSVPQLYLGCDVARKQNLAVIYLSEKIGDVLWDRMRIELHNRPFSELEFELYRLLALPQLKRACIDATGMGIQLAERAHQRFGWKVEPVNFTATVKEDLAFALRAAFEDIKLRIVRDPKLRADLRGIKKEVTPAGHIRFVGDSEDSHCDRTWALALCHYAARRRFSAGALVC